MNPIADLIADSGRVPPQRLAKPVESTPFFDVGPEGFLMLPPAGGRLHYAPGAGLALANPPDRPEGDLLPFAWSSGFAAAAWFDGRVPLRANAVRLTDGNLILIASDRDDLQEGMAVALSETFGLAVSDAPVVIDPEDASRVCTNGRPITQRRTRKDADAPPVREGARRLQLDCPTIDGLAVHPCVAMISLGDGRGPEADLKDLPLMASVAEIRKHIFMPLVGTAIWGEDTISAAHMVLANTLPILRYGLPPGAMPSAELASDLMAQLDARFRERETR